MAAGDPDTPDTEGRGPYGVSPADVAGLVSAVGIVVPGGAANSGRVPITNEAITGWINMVSATVAARIAHAVRITDVDKQSAILDAGHTIVANGAASYLEAAAHPERAALSDTTYAQVLWNRYQEGLEQLAVTIDGWIDDGTAGGTASAGAAWSFPYPTFRDRNPWAPSW